MKKTHYNYYDETKYGFFKKRRNADKAFEDLKLVAYNYGYASVYDLYEIMGDRNCPAFYKNYGWTKRQLCSLNYPVKVGEGGFYIELPKALSVDNPTFDKSIRSDYDYIDSYIGSNELDIVVVTNEVTDWKNALNFISKLVNENNDKKIHITIK